MTLEELLGDGLAETLRLFEASHTSWIGPHSFVDVEANGKWQPALDSLLKKIGYRLRVERAGLSQNGDGTRTLTLRWQNDGIAPFYFDWPARLRADLPQRPDQRDGPSPPAYGYSARKVL